MRTNPALSPVTYRMDYLKGTVPVSVACYEISKMKIDGWRDYEAPNVNYRIRWWENHGEGSIISLHSLKV